MKEKCRLIKLSRRTWLIISIILLQASVAVNGLFSQSDPFYWIPDNTEGIAERIEMENEYRVMTEDIEELKLHPVNLNSATEEELMRIPVLNALQRKNLLDYLRDYGEVFSLYELQAVPGLDSLLIRKLAGYIELLPADNRLKITPSNLFRYGRHEFIIQRKQSFPRARGYLIGDTLSDASGLNYYPGSPGAIQFRYSFSFADRLMLGISGDKDAGEEFFKGAQKNGMDYYSGYLCLSFRKYLKRLIIGNFRAGSGLGLTFGSGSAMGAYPSFITEFRPANGFRPSQSVVESSNLRGVAVNMEAGRFALQGFCSFRNRDANVLLEDTGSGKAVIFSSFIETGYHRTLSEQAKKARVPELLYGGNLNFRGNFFSIGASAYSVSYGARLQPRADLYNKFAFTGNYNFVAGTDFQIFYRFIRISGELSRSRNGSVAWIACMNLNPDPRFNIILLYRNYPAEYQNLFSNSFRQGSICRNENGWFVSLATTLPFRITLNAYADFYRFPWATFLMDNPSAGYESGLQLTYQAGKSMTLLARYICSRKEVNISGTSGFIHETGTTDLNDFRFQLNFLAGEFLALQSRIEIKKCITKGSGEQTGFLVFQDLSLKPGRKPFSLSMRYAVFDCPGYDSRISAYEPDVRYGYSMSTYYGRGLSACGILRYVAGKHLVFGFKADVIKYSGKSSIGSGLDQINANWKLDVTGQLEVRI
jgi:hypothetical protein